MILRTFLGWAVVSSPGSAVLAVFSAPPLQLVVAIAAARRLLDGTALGAFPRKLVRDPFRAGASSLRAPEPEEPAGEVVLEVTNTAAVPISVTSHFHFFEANPRLRFDRAAAYGMHLAVAGRRGGAVRAGRHPAGGAGPHRRAAGGHRVRRPGGRAAGRARRPGAGPGEGPGLRISDSMTRAGS